MVPLSSSTIPLKAERNMREAMPRAVEWLLKEGYEFKVFE